MFHTQIRRGGFQTHLRSVWRQLGDCFTPAYEGFAMTVSTIYWQIDQLVYQLYGLMDEEIRSGGD